MKYKAGVISEGVQPQLWYALGVADEIYANHSVCELTVTSLRDGVHPKGVASGKDPHGKGLAADLRTRELAPGEAGEIVLNLNHALYKLGYDIVLEKTHIHLEFDPEPGRSEWFQKEK